MRVEKKLSVVIVEDEVLIAKHIEDTLINANFIVEGLAHDSASALAIIRSQKPDFLILDINLGEQIDGINLADTVKKELDIPFIFLTALSDLATLDRAKKVNPCGYVVKPFKPRDLISSITIGLYNFEFKKSSSKLSKSQVNKVAVEDLSNKEFEVLLDMSEGFTNAQIAKKQFVSVSTIKFHSQNIYSKLDVRNRTSAIKKALGL
jgi:DNA-binding NarL/FixJ family response regulator